MSAVTTAAEDTSATPDSESGAGQQDYQPKTCSAWAEPDPTVWLPPAALVVALTLARKACCTGCGCPLLPDSMEATLSCFSCVVSDVFASVVPNRAGGGGGGGGLASWPLTADAAATARSAVHSHVGCPCLMLCDCSTASKRIDRIRI